MCVFNIGQLVLWTTRARSPNGGSDSVFRFGCDRSRLHRSTGSVRQGAKRSPVCSCLLRQASLHPFVRCRRILDSMGSCWCEGFFTNVVFRSRKELFWALPHEGIWGLCLQKWIRNMALKSPSKDRYESLTIHVHIVCAHPTSQAYLSQ